MRASHLASDFRRAARRCLVAAASGWMVLAVAGVLLPGDVRAAQPAAAGADSRWQPWLGCWQVWQDETQDDESGADASAHRAGTIGARVCVTPEGDGVRMRTTAEGKPPIEETVVADGSDRPIAANGCQGTQRAAWASSGQRLFSRATIACPGEAPHAVSHIAMIVGGTWLDVQGIARDGKEGVRIRRYRPVDPGAAPVTRSRAFGPADVKEASAHVSSLVLQAALVESGARFRLNGRTMLDLDRAGVPDEVTDLMVALSYPERFQVNRFEGSSGGGGGGLGEYDLWGFAPFAYSYWGFSDYWYGQDVIFVGGGGGGPATPSTEDGRGRVVNGRGYTRIEPVTNTVDRGRTGQGSTNASSGDASSSQPSSGSSSGGVSSEGYSSGGAGGGDRTAQPRPQ